MLLRIRNDLNCSSDHLAFLYYMWVLNVCHSLRKVLCNKTFVTLSASFFSFFSLQSNSLYIFLLISFSSLKYIKRGCSILYFQRLITKKTKVTITHSFRCNDINSSEVSIIIIYYYFAIRNSHLHSTELVFV